jgi:hypothetical protein
MDIHVLGELARVASRGARGRMGDGTPGRDGSDVDGHGVTDRPDGSVGRTR